MAISDAQFARWLKTDVDRVVLCEIDFAYESGGVLATNTIYLSMGGYDTGPSDSPANQRYLDRIEKAPDFEREIDLDTLGGFGITSVGSPSLNNIDGGADFLLDAIIDGREARFYLGARDWARSDFRLMYAAVVDKVGDDGKRLTPRLRSKNVLLNAVISGDTIATGPNAGKPKPILLGRATNVDVTPYMLDSSALKYYFNNFSIAGATSPIKTGLTVRDAGLDLRTPNFMFMDSGSTSANIATETITYVGHGLAENDVFLPSGSGACFGLSSGVQYWVIAAGLTADDFRLSLTKGGAAVDLTTTTINGSWEVDKRRYYIYTADAILELSSPPAGRVTIDVGAFGALYPTPHAAFEYLIETYSGLAAEDYDAAAMAAIATLETGVLQYARAILDRENLLDLLDEIARASGSWYAWDRSGVLTVGRLDLSNIDAATSTDTITESDILGGVACDNLALPWGKVIVDARRNVVVQTDGLAGAVTAANRSLWGQPFQVRATTTDPATATYLNNWWDYHASAGDSRPIPLPIHSGQQAAVDAITALFKPWTRVFQCSVGLDKYALDPGDCVTVTYPRYGFDAGKKFRVASVKTNLTEQRVDLVLVTHVTPDYTTSAYN